MPIDFYYLNLSAPCRAALLTARAVGVDLNLKVVNLLAKDQMKPEFLAINPQHCIPTMVDGDLKLWESRAICTYLVSQYGKDDSLYPTNPKARAMVDRLLYFDAGTISDRMFKYVIPVLFGGQRPDPDNLAKIHEALGWLEGYLGEGDWAAGNTMTVADHSLAATVSTIGEAMDLSQYPRITAWLERCKTNMPGYEELNQKGAIEWGKFFKSKVH